MVAVIVLVLPSSAIVSVSKLTASTVGLSSLKRFKVTSVSVVVAFIKVPKVKIIVSIGSTSVSSKPFVDMVTVPFVEPAGIVIGLEETVNSEVSVAVPPTVKGILISLPLGSFKVAVKVTSLEESSSIFEELNAKETVEAISSSVMVIVLTSLIELVALETVVLGVTIIVSSSSSERSARDLNLIAPVLEPATISISGLICCLIIL